MLKKPRHPAKQKRKSQHQLNQWKPWARGRFQKRKRRRLGYGSTTQSGGKNPGDSTTFLVDAYPGQGIMSSVQAMISR